MRGCGRRGIGQGIAVAFAKAGGDGAVTGLTPVGANRVSEEVRKPGRQGVAFAGDATRSSDMDRLAGDLLQQFGHLDVLVNAIATGMFPGPEQISPELYQGGEESSRDTLPLGRVGRLKEVGYLSVFLASSAADYVTGQTWAIDGLFS